MTQALYTSCTGLKAGTNQINVVSNNVANMNTTAFKASRVNFETLFYSEMSPSSTASVTSGGVNARQIGHGVQIGGITRNFEQGNWRETGRNQDMMIAGNGYFVVADSNGRTFLTRDGSFTLDSNGDMVTATGYYVMGAESTYSTTASDTKVHIPQLLNMKIEGSKGDLFNETMIKDLNNASLTAGTFTVTLNTVDATDPANPVGKAATVAVTLTQDQIDTMDMKTLATEIQTQIDDALTAADATLANYVTVEAVDGTLTFNAKTAGAVTSELEFGTPHTGASNFVEQFALSNVEKNDAGDYVSKVVNYSSTIDPVGSYNDAVTLEDWSVNNNGIISAKYSDGSTLSVVVDDNNEMTWQIVTGDFVKITGDDVDMADNVLEMANMMLEISMVVNESGLESESNNLWSIGSNAGTAYFGMAGHQAFGTIQSGGLEASNVELANELSEMILAQRLVQANSRVFSTADSTLETLVYLGQ